MHDSILEKFYVLTAVNLFSIIWTCWKANVRMKDTVKFTFDFGGLTFFQSWATLRIKCNEWKHFHYSKKNQIRSFFIYISGFLWKMVHKGGKIWTRWCDRTLIQRSKFFMERNVEPPYYYFYTVPRYCDVVPSFAGVHTSRRLLLTVIRS